MITIATLAVNSLSDNLRNRFFALSFIFSGIILYLSLILGLLAADQELRVLLDFGLGFIEIMGVFGAVYGAATTLLREIETKTIYLILTRPVSRGEYLLGRFFGLMLSILVSMLIMACVHLAILFFKGWAWQGFYLYALVGIYLKVLITAALCIFLALFTTSVLSALTMTSILWTLGHFLPEIRYLIGHKARHEAAAPFLMIFTHVVPNLQLLNFRDRLEPIRTAAPEFSLAGCFLYALAYAAVWLALSYQLLKKKEF